MIQYNFRDEDNNPIPIDYLLPILGHSISKMDFINKVVYGCTNEKPNLDAESLDHLAIWYDNNKSNKI